MFHPPEGDGFRFHVGYDIASGNVELRVAQGADAGYVAKITMEKREPLTSMKPTLSTRPREMQHLFNALWEAGFRPPERALKDDIVGAKNDHIGDLREMNTRLFSLVKHED